MNDKQAALGLFWEVFHLDIRKYYDPLFGFDVIKWDEEVIKPADGESTAEGTNRIYGPGASNIITALIPGKFA